MLANSGSGIDKSLLLATVDSSDEMSDVLLELSELVQLLSGLLDRY